MIVSGRCEIGHSYGIIEQLLDSRVDVFALFLSDQQVNVLDTRTGAQQFVDQDLSHEALKSETLCSIKFIIAHKSEVKTHPFRQL